MTDKEVLVRQLPVYLTHEFDGQRWFVEFWPPPWLDREGAVFSEEFFDIDYPSFKDYRIKLIEQRKLPRTSGWTWDEDRQGWRWIAEQVAA